MQQKTHRQCHYIQTVILRLAIPHGFSFEIVYGSMAPPMLESPFGGLKLNDLTFEPDLFSVTPGLSVNVMFLF